VTNRSSPVPRRATFRRAPSLSPARLILRFTLIGTTVGIVYAYFQAPISASGVLVELLRGAVIGAIISSVVSCFEILFLRGPTGAPLRRAPFLALIAIRAVIYLSIIFAALLIGEFALPRAADSPPVIRGETLMFGLAASITILFLFDIGRLLGPNVLLNFMLGRYYRPRIEERVFLFADMEGSTQFAERLGALDFHRLLNRFVSDLTEPIAASKGEIYKYVGDEVIATWKLADVVHDGRCVQALIAAQALFDRLAPVYEREFGARVNFRAGLHCGAVVTGEMGTVKKEIAFLGDTVNTGARIEEACRRTGHRLLASGDLIALLALPPGVRCTSIGIVPLRGRSADLELFALERQR
jgi:adenylate cyclase